MRHLLLLSLLTLAPCVGFSQTTSAGSPPAKVCFTQPEATRLRDSLQALPRVRKEARAWRLAASNFEQAALQTAQADAAHQSEAWHYKEALVSEQRLVVDARAKADKYKARAHRKGWLNAALVTVATGALYLFITK